MPYATREQVLEAFYAALGVDGFTTIRNDLTLPNEQDSFIVMLDGDEQSKEAAFNRSRPDPSIGNVIVASPEVYVVIQVPDPATAGPLLNAAVELVRRAVINDTTLRGLVIDKGIEYEGLQTAYALGRSLVAEAFLQFNLPYRPDMSAVPVTETEPAPTETESEAITATDSEPVSEPPTATESEPLSEPITATETEPPVTATETETEPAVTATDTEFLTATETEPPVTATETEPQVTATDTEFLTATETEPPVTATDTEFLTATETDAVTATEDLDADTLIAAMNVAPDTARETIIRETVASLKSAGIWDRLDCLYFMAAHDAQAARLNWVAPGSFDLTEVNSPLFTTDAGYRSNGTTSYLRSNWMGVDDAVHMSASDACMFARETTINFNTGFGRNIGGQDGGGAGGSMDLCLRTSADEAFSHILDNGIITGTGVSDSRILVAARRTAADDADLFVNGSQVATRTTTDTPALPPVEMFICCRNLNGTPSNFRASNQAVAGWGASLDDTQMATLHTIVSEYLAAMEPTSPFWVANGTPAEGVGGVTAPFPDGIEVNDIILLNVETANQPIATPTDWNVVGPWAGSAGTNPTRLQTFWRRYDGVWTMPSLPDAGDHIYAVATAIRGCITSGSPIGDVAASLDDGPAGVTTGGYAQATTSTPNQLWVFQISWGLDDAGPRVTFSQVGSNPFTDLQERHDAGTLQGNGGGFAMCTAFRAASGLNVNPSLNYAFPATTQVSGGGFGLRSE